MESSLAETYNQALEGRRRSSTTAKAMEKALKDDIDVFNADDLSDADRRLAELGYTQVYKREFSWLSCISFAFSISGLFASVTTTFVYPLTAGGLTAATWCWFISGLGCMCITLSVSELVSAYPTSGALYFTCKYLASPRWVPEVSWLDGWLQVLGQIVGLASTEYGCAQLLLAAVAMSTNMSYRPTARHTVGVMAAITFFHAVLNSFSTRFLERITRTYVIFHLGVLISCCIALLVMAPSYHSNADVWTTVAPNSGWSPPGWSFMFGFLSASWTMTDYDATAHIAEEIKDPAIKAPWSITTALGFTYLGGWLFTIVLCYCAGQVEGEGGILESPFEQPVAQIFYNVFGRAGGVTFTVFACVILSFTGMTGMQAGARTIWAVSRDELLPLSRVWYRIDQRTSTCVNAVWLLALVAVLITLIGLGSYTAVEAIFSVTAIALDWSYCIPIICKMVTGNFTPGPYHLGRWSFAINFAAVAWVTYVTIIFMLPSVRPVTPENMNYASVILVAIMGFATIYWYAHGRTYYIGPRIKAQLASSGESKG